MSRSAGLWFVPRLKMIDEVYGDGMYIVRLALDDRYNALDFKNHFHKSQSQLISLKRMPNKEELKLMVLLYE